MRLACSDQESLKRMCVLPTFLICCQTFVFAECDDKPTNQNNEPILAVTKKVELLIIGKTERSSRVFGGIDRHADHIISEIGPPR